MPLVSAIIATYNRGHIVREAIESILHQTYTNIEIIVVDDGSTDETPAKLRDYGDRIRSVYQKNSGPAAAWNRGIKESRGDIIAFLGSDDIWLPTFAESHVSLLQRAGESVPCSLSNGWLRFATGKGVTSFEHAILQAPYDKGVWLNVAEVLATRFVMFGQTVAIRRNALERTGGFDESLWNLEDHDLALKLSIQGPWGFIREPLVVWRQGTQDSLSQRALAEQVELKSNVVKIRKRALEKLEGVDRFADARRIMARELRHDRWELKAARISQTDRWNSVAVGNLMSLGERCRKFLFRRSPWFPRMETIKLEQLKP